VTLSALDFGSSVLTLADRVAGDLVSYAGGEGHPDFPCLSRTHNPSSCVPCTDFSPWLAERVRRGDADGIGEYLWQVRQANPGVGGCEAEFRRRFRAVAEALLNAPLTGSLRPADDAGARELRVALVLLAAHEGFSGSS
jgi:hypothetical protein